MVRHKAFKQEEELKNFIKNTGPSGIYYSSAYYEQPEENMELKGWSGSDLIFDVDADHLELSCKGSHRIWFCSNCGNSVIGDVPARCSKCGSHKFSEKSILCTKCLESAKEEVIKLVDALELEFGFAPHEILVYFSGHRGYHLHVENESILNLDQMARREIVDYLRGTGLELKARRRSKQELDDVGWDGRIARGISTLMSNLTDDKIGKLGLKKSKALWLKQADFVRESWLEKVAWESLDLDPDSVGKIVSFVVKEQSIKIDPIVTTDIHRLIRLPGSLHGSTGLRVTKVRKLEAFDPMREAIAFHKGTIEIRANVPLVFNFGGENYGPYPDEVVELPYAVALYLMLKSLASLIE